MGNTDHNLNLSDDSKHRIAYELMRDIAGQEKKWARMPEDEARVYILSLFEQCRKVSVGGYSAHEAMKDEKASSAFL